MNPIDTIFAYRGLGGCPSRCRVRIFPWSRPGQAYTDPVDPPLAKAEGSLIILTELADNPGTSITNAAELLATQVVATFRLDLQTCRPRWVEQYPSAMIEHETFVWIHLEWQRRMNPITNRLVFTATRTTWTP